MFDLYMYKYIKYLSVIYRERVEQVLKLILTDPIDNEFSKNCVTCFVRERREWGRKAREVQGATPTSGRHRRRTVPGSAAGSG